jgi:RES domain-containing protein
MPDLVALSIRVPLADIQTFKSPNARENSMTFPWALRQSREWGDQWLQERSSPLLNIPSSIVPIENNFLINPDHPRFKNYKIGAPQPFSIDPRIQ